MDWGTANPTSCWIERTTVHLGQRARMDEDNQTRTGIASETRMITTLRNRSPLFPHSELPSSCRRIGIMKPRGF